MIDWWSMSGPRAPGNTSVTGGGILSEDGQGQCSMGALLLQGAGGAAGQGCLVSGVAALWCRGEHSQK